MKSLSVTGFVLLSFVLVGFSSDVSAQDSSGYTALLNLFKEFREFQRPEVTDGVPDYSAAAMEAQYRELIPSCNHWDTNA